MMLFALVGVGALTLPAHVDDGAAKARLAGVKAAVAAAPVSAATKPPVATPAKPGTAPAAGELISATFAKLQADPAPALVASVNSAPPLADTPASDESRAPTRHVVQTTVVHVPAPVAPVAALVTDAVAPAAADPVPLAPAPDPVASAPAAAPVAAAAPVSTASAQDDPAPVASTPQDAPIPMPPPASPAKAAGAGMKVGGSGVSVRSGPSRSHGVLFNLAAGQKVTVSGKQRGWLQITDATGRHGWAYSNLFSKL